MYLSGTIIRGTLIQGLNRPKKRKTQLSNRAHIAGHRVRLYSHTEPRLTVFLRTEGEEGLLGGDPGEEEVTNDDYSVVAPHPDTMEFLQLSYSTQIIFRSQRGPTITQHTAQFRCTAHPRLPLDLQNDLHLARGLPAEASSSTLHPRLARG